MIALTRCFDDKTIIKRVTFDDIADMCNQPFEGDKSTSPYIFPCDFVNEYASGGDNYENIKHFELIILDYDNKGGLFDNVVAILKDCNITFVAHTSYSHAPNACEKFHIIIKLKNQVSTDDWNRFKPAILKYTPFSPTKLDSTCNYTGRGFIVPVKTEHYRFVKNIGNSFDAEAEFEPILRKIGSTFQCKKMIQTFSNISSSKTDAYKEKVIASIRKEINESNVIWSKDGVNSGKLKDNSGKLIGTNTWMFLIAGRMKFADIDMTSAMSFIISHDLSSLKKKEWERAVTQIYSGKPIGTSKTPKQYISKPTKSKLNNIIKKTEQISEKETKPEPDHFYQPDKIKDFIAKHPRRKIITFREG